ncbi:HAD family hydrolase [Halobacteriales archaeon QH_6_64_20]|nr:MAG: HAD family hydrolase [Halobacteriales archaeon QH_6_64_20]
MASNARNAPATELHVEWTSAIAVPQGIELSRPRSGSLRMVEYTGAIIDLDGTVWRGDDLIDGAREGIDALREAGVAVTFVSNGTDIDRDAFDERLEELGLPTDIEVITAASATAEYLADEHPDAEAFVIGQQPIAAELDAAGISATDVAGTDDADAETEPADSGPADVVVAGREPDLNEALLDDVLAAFDAETTFVATNTDRTHPIGGEEIIPGAGATIGAIQGMTGTEPTVVGKPAAQMAETAGDRHRDGQQRGNDHRLGPHRREY